MKSLGICLGASRISAVLAAKDSMGNYIIDQNISEAHDGDVSTSLKNLLNHYDASHIGITGRKFRNLISVPSISEAEAVEIAYAHTKSKYKDCDTIVSAGGETFLVYKLDQKGRVSTVFTGNKCASGTGEFFLQQLKRMDVSVDDAMKIVDKDAPYTVAGRCSVFCKSDCTHALNKGMEKGRVIAGLCQMMGNKILELLHKGQSRKILFIGSATKNHTMLHFIKQELNDTAQVVVADEATYFEALGASIWAIENGSVFSNKETILKEKSAQKSFVFLPAIKDFENQVTFKKMLRVAAEPKAEYIVGLDVGSTTTKAVLIRKRDSALSASIYLRTNGDPILASRQCYAELLKQIAVPIQIAGVGVTGSGRQIAGIHAQTDGVVNEIIAHATAAVHFDPEVDTIFEIGGQDAKYTYITNMVPSDYAMNEACSAGTGSFLEEAAKETMGIDMLEIADIALGSTTPPNFNDQCSAFISSDIKTAIQEGIKKEDVVAGLVYSICQNYTNRVKGNRLVGKKVFMQGGVCYNRAVPMAMAALTGKEIIVPPEPGLMGAYGVALDIKNKLELGLLKEQSFDLADLASREVKYDKPFVCAGGKEKCDRKCQINMIRIDGKKYPFGGACNKYYNIRKNVDYNIEDLDLVALRERMTFETYAKPARESNGKKIGIIKSLLTNGLYPLYHAFFSNLGYEVVLADYIDNDGVERKGASFCYPVEQSHGFLQSLLHQSVDYIFLPHVMGMFVKNGIESSVTCPFVQGEPYYLKTAFPELKNMSVLSPMIDLSKGVGDVKDVFVAMGRELGIAKTPCVNSFEAAKKNYQAYQLQMKAIGKEVLNKLHEEPDKIGIVLFGRQYSALSKNANMGIPHKFASRGQLVIPWEFINVDGESPVHHMFWSMGQLLLKMAQIVKNDDQLFGTYITNFSCGPDSFIIGYFRDILGQKPSLTLELDGHTADAGIDTRIEAFLDVIKSYRELIHKKPLVSANKYRPAELVAENGKSFVVTSNGEKIGLTDNRVELIVPSMGEIGSRLFAASIRYAGVQARCLSPATEADLAVGRAHSSCKECLPYILVAGSVLRDIEKRQNDEELLVYFITDSSGPCRFGQYHIAVKRLIHKLQIKNVVILSLTSDNGYAGLGGDFQLRAWQTILISDVLADIYSALLVMPTDSERANILFQRQLDLIEAAIEKGSWRQVKRSLEHCSQELAKIPVKQKIEDTASIALLGEIFVRIDGFSRKYLVETMAEKGIIVKVAPVAEFVYFCDFLLEKAYYHVKNSFVTRTMSIVKSYFKKSCEKQVKKILMTSGFYQYHLIDIATITGNTEHLISPRFTAGDATLTVASALNEIIDEVDGVISISPFGCMPSRIAEAIISETISQEKAKITHDPGLVEVVLQNHPALPFLSIESDGNPFPQVVDAKLEIFCLQVMRIHDTVLAHRNKKA
ncbi:MAG: CoA-substrate-specific enzyme activase [Firmicutes bacterium]|nr:CoA-substrate-specific enzyme activase [Bacillota bacterium]